MQRLAPHALLLVLALPFSATAAETFVQSPAYKECTGLASTNPSLALQKAEAWLKIDQGIAARHCRAMALYGLHRFEEAAIMLADVRSLIPRDNITLRSYVARQSSRGWFNAGRPDAAVGILSDQVNDMATLTGDNATTAKLTSELLLDRAKLRENYGQLPEAVQDLDHAVSLSPTNEEILLERARVFELLGDIPLAKQDLQALLRVDPKHEVALERMRKLRDTSTKKK